MTAHKHYDHIVVTSSDIRTDRRMMRMAVTLSSVYDRILVICRDRQLGERPNYLFETKWIGLKNAGGPIFYGELVFRYIHTMRSLSFGSLTCVDADTILVGRYFKVFRTIKVYYDAHENFPEVPELVGKPLKKWLWKRIEKWGVSHTDRCSTVNQTLAEELGRRLSCSFVPIRNLPELVARPLEKQEHSWLRLIYLGVLNKGRGIEEVLNALVGTEGITLDLVGNGDLEFELRETSQRLGLCDKVVFHGWQPPEILHEFLNNKDVGLNLLSLESGSYRHSLANKFFDYIHSGVPVLTMDFPEYRYYCEKYNIGWLMRDLEVGALREKLVQLRNDKGRWHSMIDHCLMAKKTLNWQLESQKVVQHYTK